MKCPKCGRELISAGMCMCACICTILNYELIFVYNNVYTVTNPTYSEQSGGGSVNFHRFYEPSNDQTSSNNPFNIFYKEKI